MLSAFARLLILSSLLGPIQTFADDCRQIEKSSHSYFRSPVVQNLLKKHSDKLQKVNALVSIYSEYIGQLSSGVEPNIALARIRKKHTWVDCGGDTNKSRWVYFSDNENKLEKPLIECLQPCSFDNFCSVSEGLSGLGEKRLRRGEYSAYQLFENLDGTTNFSICSKMPLDAQGMCMTFDRQPKMQESLLFEHYRGIENRKLKKEPALPKEMDKNLSLDITEEQFVLLNLSDAGCDLAFRACDERFQTAPIGTKCYSGDAVWQVQSEQGIRIFYDMKSKIKITGILSGGISLFDAHKICPAGYHLPWVKARYEYGGTSSFTGAFVTLKNDGLLEIISGFNIWASSREHANDSYGISTLTRWERELHYTCDGGDYCIGGVEPYQSRLSAMCIAGD